MIFCARVSADIVVAGGMESMSNAPYLLERARSGYRMGHGRVVDSMFLDGLEDAYDKGRLMGTFAEDCAQDYQFTREAQDAYALASLERANRAIRDGAFAGEIVAGKDQVRQGRDERGRPTSSRRRRGPRKSRRCSPAFREGGTVTAANSSSISDGAAALVLMRESEAEKRGLAPLARIVGHATYAAEPGKFPTAPIGAMQQAVREDRLERRRRRSLRDQRGLRRRRDGGDARPRPSARQGQRQRRRLRARPSHRRLGRAHPGHAARGAEGARA